jgi:ATP-dependent Clp protease adaptor protein ClpS
MWGCEGRNRAFSVPDRGIAAQACVFRKLLAWNGGAKVIKMRVAACRRGPRDLRKAVCLGQAMTSIANDKSHTQLSSAGLVSRTGTPRMADDDRKRKSGDPGGPGTAVITKTKTQTKKPNLYRVLILNDDYTPMEFVTHVLERFFGKDHEAATRIMLHVHHHGIGECGIYTYEVAETKVTQVMDFARKHQHPLQCVMEKK